MVRAHYGGLNALVAARGRLLAALLVVALVHEHAGRIGGIAYAAVVIVALGGRQGWLPQPSARPP